MKFHRGYLHAPTQGERTPLNMSNLKSTFGDEISNIK